MSLGAARVPGQATPQPTRPRTPEAVTGVTPGRTTGTRDAGTASDPSFTIIELRADAPGPTIAFVAGVHGGKRAAVAALDRAAGWLPGALQRGRVLLVPAAHEAALASGLAQRSPVDSLNLNRVFPGRADGRPTERLAHTLMVSIVAESDYLVDLHGSDGEERVGRFAYAAHPGLDPAVDTAALALARAWGAPRVVWDADGPRQLADARFLQTAAHLAGVPAITVFEAGSTAAASAATAAFERGVRRVLAHHGMLGPGSAATGVTATGVADTEAADGAAVAGPAGPMVVHARRTVSTAPATGRWVPAVAPEAAVRAGELLGTFIGSSGARTAVRAPQAGVVLHVRRTLAVSAGTTLAILADRP